MLETIHVQLRERVRLDIFLTRRLPHVSRNRIQRAIERGDVLVDGRTVRPSHLLGGGETLVIPALAGRELANVSETMPLRIVYEDDDVVVVDKAAGVLVHPVGDEFRRTLLNGLHRYLESRGEDPGELGIVHRIDRLTSGLVVVAKRLAARRAMSRAVEERRVRRIYLAVVAGLPPAPSGVVELFVRRDPVRPTRMQALDAEQAAMLHRSLRPHVSRSGYSDPRLDLRPRAARTHWRILRRFRFAALLQLELETGRTHQIRVHMQAVGLPLVGDPIYGAPAATPGLPRGSLATLSELREASEALGRPALHASSLSFVHPRTGARLRFRARVPDDLRQLVASLGAPG